MIYYLIGNFTFYTGETGKPVWGEACMEEQSGKQIKIIISAAVAVLILVVTLFCTEKIQAEMQMQLSQNLEDVANQNAMALRNQVHSNEQLLKGLISEMQHSDEKVSTGILKYTNFVEVYGLKRMGYCMTDGMTVSTDGVVADLSFREFFRRGMNGQCTITGVLTDAMGDDHGRVTVMSMPVRNVAGDIEGVACLTYNSDKFNDSLQMESFEGKGYSFAINEAGEIMVAMGNDQLELSQNLFGDVLGRDQRNTEVIKQICDNLAQGESTQGTMYLKEEDYFFATPVTFMDGEITWYMFTVIPADFLNHRITAIQKNLLVMDFFVILSIMSGILLFVYTTKAQQRELIRLAYIDPVTGGANFARFCQVVDNMHDKRGYLVSADIQNFNSINIAAGREAGDRMLKDVWEILESSLREHEMAGRMREDHFALFLAEDSREALVERMEEISGKVHDRAVKMQVPGVYLRYGVCILEENEAVEDGYSRARSARNCVNEDHARHYMFYSEINQDEIRENQMMEEKFDQALEEQQFEVWYQPKYSVDGSQIVGSEALVRWRKSDGSMVSPGRFIPLFEKNGMIARLDEYMFRTVCRQQAEWLKAGYNVLPVSINLSRASLYYSDIVERYECIIKECDLDTNYIQLEVTESALEGKADILGVLGKFRDMGVQILMDDFGTGYSSLATLNMRCFDTLKLDKSLIDHIGDESGETLLYHVVSMGQQLGLHITAEGVETMVQLKYLQKLNCDDIQGFLFARPMPSDEFESRMGSREA